jgi:poly(3-hydroxybutyrate) depolymerase
MAPFGFEYGVRICDTAAAERVHLRPEGRAPGEGEAAERHFNPSAMFGFSENVTCQRCAAAGAMHTAALRPSYELRVPSFGLGVKMFRVAKKASTGKLRRFTMHTLFPLRRLVLSIIILIAFAVPVLRGAEVAFPSGSGKMEVTAGGQRIEVFTYRPSDYKDGPLILVFHGMLRNADTYRDNAKILGDRFHALIAAPRFETNRFPSEAYQRGGVTKKGAVQPREDWTYSLVPKIVDELRRRAGNPALPYYYIGHSAGGQFLVRMSAFLPTETRRMVAANPGAHIFPTRESAFPYGFGGLPDELGNDAALRRFLAQPLTLYLGTADVLSKDLDTKAEAMKQGATRIERGRNCFRSAQELAKEKGWPFNWRLVEADGIGHDSSKMFAHPNAGLALFGEECLTEPPGKGALMKRVPLSEKAAPAKP